MSAGFSFDPDAIADLIEAAVDSFDWTLPGEAGQSLGRDLAVTVADGMASRANQGNDVDGEPFRENEDKYAKYKMRRYAVDRPGELGGQMLSLESLLGKPEVDAATVRMTYGTGEAPARKTARGGKELYPSELEATDRQKAEWFEARGQKFYGLDDTIKAAVVAQAGERFLRHLGDAGLL